MRGYVLENPAIENKPIKPEPMIDWGKALFVVMVVLAALSWSACTFSTTLAQSLAGIEAALTAADPTLEAGLAPYFSAAITAAENWKAGTFSQQLEEGLSVLANNLDLIPLGSKADTIISAGIYFIDNEISILQKAQSAQLKSPAEMEAVFYAWLDDSNSAPPPASATRKHRWHGKQIKSLKQFKAAAKAK